MSIFQRWIGLFVIAAFVVSTMPVVAHASVVYGHVKQSEVSQPAPEHHNCHHADKAEAVKKEVKADTKCPSCCEKACKCLSGGCSGPVGFVGSASVTLKPLSAGMTYTGLSDDFSANGRDGRLKRPPRA